MHRRLGTIIVQNKVGHNQRKDPDGRGPPVSAQRQKARNYNPAFKTQPQCHVPCKIIANPRSEFVISRAFLKYFLVLDGQIHVNIISRNHGIFDLPEDTALELFRSCLIAPTPKRRGSSDRSRTKEVFAEFNRRPAFTCFAPCCVSKLPTNIYMQRSKMGTVCVCSLSPIHTPCQRENRIPFWSRGLRSNLI